MAKPIFIADSAGNYQTVKPATKKQIIAFAHELTIPDFVGNTVIRSHQDAVEFLTLALNNQHKEQFGLIFLSTKNQVIAFEIVATGNLTSAYVDPRTVVTRVLELGANAVIAAHNHPSGSSEPSQQDHRSSTVRIASY